MSDELKRIPVKFLRDYIKKDYKDREPCYICKSEENIELHHLYGLSELFNTWCEKNGIKEITTVDTIKELREKFVNENQSYLANENLYSLCSTHHERLHNIYGQRYENRMAEKVKKWMDIQKQKFLTKETLKNS